MAPSLPNIHSLKTSPMQHFAMHSSHGRLQRGQAPVRHRWGTGEAPVRHPRGTGKVPARHPVRHWWGTSEALVRHRWSTGEEPIRQNDKCSTKSSPPLVKNPPQHKLSENKDPGKMRDKFLKREAYRTPKPMRSQMTNVYGIRPTTGK